MLTKSSIKGKLFKSIVWSIVFTLFITVLPILNAHAETKKENEEPIKNTQELEELPQLRTENSKTYLDNEKNQYIYEEYTEPIHYKQGNEWEDINNTIVNGKSESDDQDLSLENKSNRFKVKFSKKSKDNRTLRIKLKDQQLSFGIVGANKVQGIAKDNSMTYPGVFQDTDLNFQVDNNAVKEALILNKNTKKNKFTYEFKLKNLVAKKDKEGNIVFENQKGKTFYVLSKPFMYDSAEAISHDLSMELREEKGKTYVDVTADEKWLNSSERKYPVVVDPTVDVQDGNTADTFISSTYPNSNYYTDPSLITGKQVYYGTTRSLVKFNLKNLLSGAKITSAKVTVSSHSNTSGFEKQANVSVYPITKSWNSNSVNWNNQPTTDAVISNQNISTDGDYTFYTTNLAKDWYSGKKANYGIMLKNTDETADRKMFRSSDYSTDTSKKPKLTVAYTIDPIGVESYWTTDEANVNTYNGNFFKQETDVNIEGRGLSLMVSRNYNSRSTSSGIFGYGWSSNLDRSLTLNTDDLVMYRDEDGTEHYFSKNSTGEYDSPGGLSLQLNKNTDGTFKLTDKDQSYLTFDAKGKIIAETDSNNNKLTYIYSVDRLVSIKDSSGRELELNYGTNGKVSNAQDPAGRQYNYSYDSNQNLTGVSKVNKGSIIFNTPYSYDSGHQMTSFTDKRGNKTLMTYNSSKQLIKQERPVTAQGTIKSDYYNVAYDTANSVTTITDSRGVKTQYTHNAYGNVIKSIEDVGGLNYTTTYEYDDQNNLIIEKDPNANKSGSNASSNYTYDAKGNIIIFSNPLNGQEKVKFDESNNPVEFTTPKGNVSMEQYDNNNNNIASTDAETKSSAVKYDSKNNVIEETNYVSIGENILFNGSFELDTNKDNWPDNWKKSGTASFIYESEGAAVEEAKLGTKQIKISNPTTAAAVESTPITYNPEKKYVVSGYIKTTNAKANAKLVVTGGNGSGQMTKTISSSTLSGTTDVERMHFTINPGDLPGDTKIMTLKAYANAGSGDYYFDGLQIEEEHYGEFNLIENSNFELDTNNDGNPDGWYTPSTLTASDGIDKNTAYTGNQSIKLTGQRGVDKFVRQELNVNGKSGQEITVSGFSKVNSPTKSAGSYQMNIAINHTDGTTQWVNGDFDKSKSHDWQHVSLSFKTKQDFKSLTVYYQYKDQTGTAWFDSAKAQIGNISMKYAYDAAGNYIINTTDQVGNTLWDSYDEVGNLKGQTIDGDTKQFEYDSNDNKTKVIDEKNHETIYKYDEEGNQTSTIDANSNKTNFTYDERNNITSYEDALGRKIFYDYDSVGNKTKVTSPDGKSIEYAYDNVDRVKATSYNGTKRYEYNYDANGNLISEKDLLTGITTNLVYDLNNQIKEKNSSNGIKNVYSYDEDGNLIDSTYTSGAFSVAIKNEYDKNNEISKVLSGNTSTTFTFTENNLLSNLKNKNGTSSLFNYNGAGQMTRLLINKPDGSLIDSFDYRYDKKGNLVTEKSENGLVNYTYDKTNQLLKEIRPNGDVYEYSYDNVGNRLSKKITKGNTETTTNYTYDKANQLLTVNGQTIQHDKNGNMISDGKRTYVYDEANRLIEVKDGNNSIAKYQYNSSGLRISKIEGSNTVNYTYDENNNVMLETDSNGKVLVSYVYDNNNNPLSMTKDGKTYTFHTNSHKDIIKVTDENSNVVANFEYDAWGNILKEAGPFSSSVPFRYSGYRYDTETKLYYLQQRYYNPELGRFLTRDTFYGFQDAPISQNLYAYVSNNPVMFNDYSGNIQDPIFTYVRAMAFLAIVRTILSSVVKVTFGKLFKKKAKNKYKLDLQFFSKNIKKGISPKLLNGDKVRLDMFKNGKYNRWKLEKDRGRGSGAGGHGGSYWKLKHPNFPGKYWSLAKDGKVLRFG